jgi:DNA-binding transcriptional ArsR family regulator
MVYSQSSLDAVFGALADPTRRAIVARLARGETTVGELARPFPMSLPAVGKHLVVLERARLVQRRRDGRVRHVCLTPTAMAHAADWLEPYRHLWEHHLDRLAAHLGELSERTRPKRRDPHE